MVMDLDRFCITAHTSRFDIDNPATAEFEGSLSICKGVNTLVEADGRLEFPLELGMIVDIVTAKWLLDQKQVILIHCSEEICVFKPVRGIGIHLQ
jgi:hypothetical protein